jgi:hypothetical protein
MDPRRTADMMQEEEKAREDFEDTKEVLKLFCLSGWVEQFKKHIQDFIQEQVDAAANIIAAPVEEEEDVVRLHGLRRLVAGAVQEEELVQQSDYANAQAKLDGAIVWDGRGYVIVDLLICCLTHLPRVNLRKFRQRYGW